MSSLRRSSLPDTVPGQNGDNLCDKPDSYGRKKDEKRIKIKIYFLTAKASWNSKTSMSFKVNPAFSRTLGVLYAGLEWEKNKTFSLITVIKLCPPELLWRPEHSPQKQLIFGVLGHKNKISKMKIKKKRRSATKQQQQLHLLCSRAPEIGFRFEAHG